jgi:hypothetical protein
MKHMMATQMRFASISGLLFIFLLTKWKMFKQKATRKHIPTLAANQSAEIAYSRIAHLHRPRGPDRTHRNAHTETLALIAPAPTPSPAPLIQLPLPLP